VRFVWSQAFLRHTYRLALAKAHVDSHINRTQLNWISSKEDIWTNVMPPYCTLEAGEFVAWRSSSREGLAVRADWKTGRSFKVEALWPNGQFSRLLPSLSLSLSLCLFTFVLCAAREPLPNSDFCDWPEMVKKQERARIYFTIKVWMPIGGRTTWLPLYFSLSLLSIWE
jgi:hypothetical protein